MRYSRGAEHRQGFLMFGWCCWLIDCIINFTSVQMPMCQSIHRRIQSSVAAHIAEYLSDMSRLELHSAAATQRMWYGGVPELTALPVACSAREVNAADVVSTYHSVTSSADDHWHCAQRSDRRAHRLQHGAHAAGVLGTAHVLGPERAPCFHLWHRIQVAVCPGWPGRNGQLFD